MSFNVSMEAYSRFMGRFSEPLAVRFADLAGLTLGQRALDVGSGPGALTAVLVERLGASAVSAIDPSASFVAAVLTRFPGVDVRTGSAEALPFDDDSFDIALAQLVVHFMADPVAGLREMGRVVKPGGLVAACVWDHAGGSSPLSTFWRAVHDLDPTAHDESNLAGAREGHLVELSEAAGLNQIEPTKISVDIPFASCDDWWEPFTFGVGPAGAHVAGLDDEAREALRARCEALLPSAPFTVTASAWCVVARP
jgi:SAM-dependent methyltransferase